MDKATTLIKETIFKMLGSWQSEFEEANGRHKMNIHITEADCRFIHEIDNKQIENFVFDWKPQSIGGLIILSFEKRKFYIQRLTELTLVFGETNGEKDGDAKWQRIFRKAGTLL